MKPVSAVDNSNYHLLGNQLKGESHSSRMARVHAMQRDQAGPTLQPLGSFNASGAFSSPLLLAGLAGLAIGAMNTKPTGSPKSIEKGKQGATKAGLIGGGLAFILVGGMHLLGDSPLPEGNILWDKIPKELPTALASIGLCALTGVAMHGLGRSAKWTLFP